MLLHTDAVYDENFVYKGYRSDLENKESNNL